MSEITQKVLGNTYTISDAYERLSILEAALQTSFYSEGATDVKKALAQNNGADQRDAASAVLSWGDDVFASFAESDLGMRFDALKKELSRLPLLTLSIAAPLTGPDRNRIGLWCRHNVDPNVLLDLRIDKAAAGGCFLVWKNKFYDLSLPYFLDKHRAQLTEFFLSKSAAAASPV